MSYLTQNFFYRCENFDSPILGSVEIFVDSADLDNVSATSQVMDDPNQDEPCTGVPAVGAIDKKKRDFGPLILLIN